MAEVNLSFVIVGESLKRMVHSYTLLRIGDISITLLSWSVYQQLNDAPIALLGSYLDVNVKNKIEGDFGSSPQERCSDIC
jgi:hypothetical protein